MAVREISDKGSFYSIRLKFRDYTHSQVVVKADIPKSDVEKAVAEFGYSRQEFEALENWHTLARKSAIAKATARLQTGEVSADSREELDKKVAAIERLNQEIEDALEAHLTKLAEVYKRRRRRLYERNGLRLSGERSVQPDIPALARRNAPRLAPVSAAFAEIMRKRRYEMKDLVASVSLMVQTVLRYEPVARAAGDKMTGGVLPPPKSLIAGKGDCDTKSALLASILLNLDMRLIGLSLPGHYLLGVQAPPKSGDAFVNYRGEPYLLIEPSGPDPLPPGRVTDETRRLLGAGGRVEVQPF